MTSIGVSTYRHDNPKEMFVPMYSYRVPAGRRVQLVAVKEGIFHPRLPSIRQMDRDNNLQKLSDEHCRTSMPMSTTSVDFQRAPISSADHGLATYPLTELGRDQERNKSNIKFKYTPEELRKTRQEWSDFLNRCPERFNIKLTEHPDTANTPFTGYAMRYLKPEVTAKWRYTLREEPNLDSYGQRPAPATTQ